MVVSDLPIKSPANDNSYDSVLPTGVTDLRSQRSPYSTRCSLEPGDTVRLRSDLLLTTAAEVTCSSPNIGLARERSEQRAIQRD